MVAYEFESPGSHMASLGNSNSNSGLRSAGIIKAGSAPLSPGAVSDVSTNFNMFRNDERYSLYDYGSHGRDSLEDYVQPYLKYNSELFSRAMDYDKMMSDTAIRRQMEDLKASGINPILAGRLGGAQYKGVSAPYMTINPSGFLSAFSSFQGNSYDYDARMKEMASREGISKRELESRMNIAEKEISSQLRIAGLNNDRLLEIAKLNNLNDKQIARMNNAVKLRVQECYNEVLKEMNDANITSQEEIAKNDRINRTINTTISSLSNIVDELVTIGSMGASANSFGFSG